MARLTHENDGFRQRISRKIFRDKSQDLPKNTSFHLPRQTQVGPPHTTNSSSTPQGATFNASSFCSTEASHVAKESTNTEKEVQLQSGQIPPHQNSPERDLTSDRLTAAGGLNNDTASTDLWSAAYREAVESLQKEIDIATLKGKDAAHLFEELEHVAKEATHKSFFVRGMRYLQTLQVPLERFKDALDLATPLANLEPTAGTVLGVVRGLTAIAISFANADSNFADQLESMLDHISYIDECDTLGRKAEEKKIHKALVSVYQKILEFYQAVCEILKRKGTRLIIKMVLESDRLPSIVQDVMKRSNILQNLVEITKLRILQDIDDRIIDQQVRSWLGAEKMTRQTQYHEEWTTLRADQTCEFILSDTHFVNWYYASGSRQLVLLGEMGCGKTITMAFIVEQLRLREKENDQLPNPKICYHYCRDNETGKGVTILSVLILSLLQQLPGLKRQFSDWYKQVEKSGIPDPAASVQNLEDFLQKTLKSIDRPVFIVIDGLDECEKRTRKWLLEFLKNMLENIPSLRILLSSRPQENVLSKLGDAARIELGSNAQRDRIIVEKTVDTHLSDLSAEAKALVIHKLSDLAEGCAIWTKMTVKLIELRGLTMETEIKRFLEKMALPNELSELYNLLLSRCTGNDSENVQLAITALKLLAVTERPLSILELAWAATLSVAHDVTTVDALGERVDHRRILSLIHPFISRVDFSDVKKYQVRLVHQSVNEFILKECMSECLQIQGPAKGEADRMSIDQRSKRLESFILGICIRYLLLDEISKRDLFSEEQVAIAELPPECDIFSDGEEPLEYNPNCSWETWEENMIRFEPTERGFGEFFVYASCYWLKHFGTVEAEPLPGLINIERLCQAGSIRLHNWIQQNCRPGCTIAPRFEFDYRLYDPLSITSLYGSVAMLRNMLKNSNFAKDVFLADPAMGAADQILRWGDNSRLRVLFFDDQVGHQLRNLDFFRRIIKTWQDSPANSHHWDDVFALVDVVLDTMVQGRWGNELLCVAASAGCMPIIRRLMNSARHNEDLRSELFRGSRIEPQWTVFEPVHQSIGEAILGNHVDVVKYLVKENNIDAHLRYQNSRGENVLHLASIMCNPEMFDLLAPRFPEGVTQVDDRGDTALVRVVMNFSASGNRFESARILLSQTADWHLAEKHYRRLFMNLADDS